MGRVEFPRLTCKLAGCHINDVWKRSQDPIILCSPGLQEIVAASQNLIIRADEVLEFYLVILPVLQPHIILDVSPFHLGDALERLHEREEMVADFHEHVIDSHAP